LCVAAAWQIIINNNNRNNNTNELEFIALKTGHIFNKKSDQCIVD